MQAAPILESFTALADPTRCRLLLLVERHELTVSELCAILQLPQSTVSRHLKTLADAGLVSSRRDGTSRYYSLALDESHATIWDVTRGQLERGPGAAQDARRLERVLARRRETSAQFFASSAGQWDRLREELFGGDFYLRALLGLLDEEWVIGDLGCGTGVVTAALAPNVARVIGVDASGEMLAAAKARLGRSKSVDLRKGTLEALPIDAASLDAAVMMLVLRHLPSPADALADAARVLKPGGRLLIVDMTPHDHEEYRQQMGHVWLGFSDDHMRRLLTQAGFDTVKIHALPDTTEAKGPGLFAATGKRKIHM
jgi:ArsR family transcriptional regulator